MLGLLIIIVMFAVLGTLYAWAATRWGKPDVSVRRGVIIVTASGLIAAWIASGDPETAWIALPLIVVLLTIGGLKIAKLGWGLSAALAVAFTLIQIAVNLGLLIVLGAFA